MRTLLPALALVGALAAIASAQEAPSRPDPEREKLEQRVKDLEERLRRIEGIAPPSTAVPAQDAKTPQTPPEAQGGTKPPEDRITDLEKTVKDAVHAIVDNVRLTAMLDASYVWNWNDPRGKTRNTNILILNDPDTNTFEITWAKFGFGRPVNHDANEWDAGFELEFGAGREAQNVLSLTPDFLFHEPFNLAQDYVDLQVPTPYNPILIRFGRQYGFIGTESLDTPTNPNYSLSYITNFTPFTVTGFAVGMDLGAGFRYSQYVVNAWDFIIDNNASKTYGGQLQWQHKDPDASITFNWIYGCERDDNNHDARWLADLDAYFAPIEETQLRASLLFGQEDGQALHESGVTGGIAKFGAAQLIFRQEFYEVREHLRRFAAAARTTYYRDQGGSETGTDQALWEVTGTFEVHFSEHAKIRFEVRRDQSTEPIFLGRNGRPNRFTQVTTSVDAAFAF